MQGWIKLHRNILNWEWFSEPNTLAFFIYCLTKASHKEFKYRGKTISKGCFWFGLKVASAETGLSIQKIRTCVKRLKSTKEITIKTSLQGSVITVLNWEKYQDKDSIATNEQQTSNKQATTYKNVKNVKNDKNNILMSSEDAMCDENSNLLPLDNDAISRKNQNTEKQLKEKQFMQDVVNIWNNTAKQVELPQIKVLSESRRKKLKKAIKDIPELEDWKKLIFQVPQEPWRIGFNDRGWKANFDYIFSKENYLKLLEDFYADPENEVEFMKGKSK